jgi:hypothetical protein
LQQLQIPQRCILLNLQPPKRNLLSVAKKS